MSRENESVPVAKPPTADDMIERLRHARAKLRGHGGDVVVRGVSDDGEVALEFVGACRGCPAIGFTYGAVIEPAIVGLAGVTGLKVPQVNLSPFALRRIRRLAQSSAR